VTAAETHAAPEKREAIKRRHQGEETLGDIGRSYNVSAATISRLESMNRPATVAY
jgi:hypothetical protein